MVPASPKTPHPNPPPQGGREFPTDAARVNRTKPTRRKSCGNKAFYEPICSLPPLRGRVKVGGSKTTVAEPIRYSMKAGSRKLFMVTANPKTPHPNPPPQGGREFHADPRNNLGMTSRPTPRASTERSQRGASRDHGESSALFLDVRRVRSRRGAAAVSAVGVVAAVRRLH